MLGKTTSQRAKAITHIQVIKEASFVRIWFGKYGHWPFFQTSCRYFTHIVRQRPLITHGTSFYNMKQDSSVLCCNIRDFSVITNVNLRLPDSIIEKPSLTFNQRTESVRRHLYYPFNIVQSDTQLDSTLHSSTVAYDLLMVVMCLVLVLGRLLFLSCRSNSIMPCRNNIFLSYLLKL